jgi:acetoin utilization protein AcuB
MKQPATFCPKNRFAFINPMVFDHQSRRSIPNKSCHLSLIIAKNRLFEAARRCYAFCHRRPQTVNKQPAPGGDMIVKSLMIPAPITVSTEATIQEAIELMKINSIRHLPVVDGRQKLQGFLTLADLKQALIPSMLGDISLSDLMIKNPICLSPEDDIERAAQLIYKHKISGIPVISRGRKLVGIITESDLLRAFIDMMGILSNSARLDITTNDDSACLNKAIQIIHDQGGDIINVGMTAQRSVKRTYYFRLTPCDTLPIKQALEKDGFAVQAVMD